MAAVVIDAARTRQPALSAEQVRSAVVNTADEGVLTSSADGTTVVGGDVNITGAGLADLAKAVGGRVAVGPVSTSFGSMPSGSGQTRTAMVTLSSLTGTAVTVTPTVDSVAGTGVAFSVPATPVTVPATGSVTATVTVTVPRGAAAGDHSAMLNLSTGGVEVAHSVLYAFVNQHLKTGGGPYRSRRYVSRRRPATVGWWSRVTPSARAAASPALGPPVAASAVARARRLS